MSSKQVSDVNKPRTVGELLAHLQSIKDSWTELDIQHLGKFEDYPMYLAVKDQGVSRGYIQFDPLLGLISYED